MMCGIGVISVAMQADMSTYQAGASVQQQDGLLCRVGALPAPLLEFARPQFTSGRNLSVRRGRKWLSVPVAAIRVGPDRPAVLVALTCRLCRFSQLTAADLVDEHDPDCRDPAGLLATLQRFYPGFDPGHEVTLVSFCLPQQPGAGL